jgi:hypothetical protein
MVGDRDVAALFGLEMAEPANSEAAPTTQDAKKQLRHLSGRRH